MTHTSLPTGWLSAKLGDCCEIISGGTPKRDQPEFWDGTIPWVTPKDISDIDDPVFTDPPESITELGLRKSSAVLVPKGAILFSSRAPIGLVAIAGRPMATNQGFKSLVPGSDLDSGFLYHAIKRMVPMIAAKGNGATFKEVSKSVMSEIEIAFPQEIDEQRRIAMILDKAEVVRRTREKAISFIDTLLRSSFLELFGDPITNPHGFDSCRVETLLSKTRGTQSGPFGSSLKKHEYVSEGIPVWGVENVQENYFLPNAKLFITETKFHDLKRYAVEEGDILISRAGTVGRMCVARPATARSIISTNLVRVALDKEQITSEYFVSLFTYLPHRLGGLRANQKDGAFTFLNPKTLRSLNIPVPPLKLQERYVELVRQVELLSERSKAQLTLADNACRALSQRAFRSEL